MTEKRKQIKLTLPADKVALFYEAKATAEQSAMMEMTDAQYASRLFAWALRQASDK